jgi:carboxymethylenebutenolidase
VLPVPDFNDPANRAGFMQAIRPLAEQLTPEATARDGAAYLDFLAGIAPGPVAITGYCMGGRVGWRIAAAHPDRILALASFHGGGLVTDAPDSPHRSADAIKAELYFGHADHDPSMSAEQVAELDRALDQAGVRYRTEVYEGAMHGYTMSDTAAYDEVACERHFTELFALLARTVGSG